MRSWTAWCVAGVGIALGAGCGTEPPAEEQRAEVSSTPVPKTIELGDGVHLEMVLIPAGSFTMGDNGELEDEKPARKVTISKPFYLGKYEVTIRQFRRFVEATGYATDAERGLVSRVPLAGTPTRRISR